MIRLVNSKLQTALYQPNGDEISLSIYGEQTKRTLYMQTVTNDVNNLVNTQVFQNQAYESLEITNRSTPVRVQIKVTDNQLYVRNLGEYKWKEVPIIDSSAIEINQEILKKGATIWGKIDSGYNSESEGIPPSLSTRQMVPIQISHKITQLEEALRSAQAQLEVERRVHEELGRTFGIQGEQLTSTQGELESSKLQNRKLAHALGAAHLAHDEKPVVIERLEYASQGATGHNAPMHNKSQDEIAAHEEEPARLGVDHHQEPLDEIRHESAAAQAHLCLELTQANTEACAALTLDHAAQVRQLNKEQQAQLAPLQQRVRELEEQIPRLEDQYRVAMEELQATHVVALRDQEQRLNEDKDRALDALRLTHQEALRQLTERLDQRQVEALEGLQREHEEALRLRDETHALAIQGKAHDIAELRREHDEATQLLVAEHANALRQLTERLGQEETHALDTLQHDHEEVLHEREQRLGEDKKRALELLQTQNVETLRVQTEEHARALEELRRQHVGAIGAVQRALEESRVQQRAAQEGTQLEAMGSIDLEIFDPVAGIRGNRAASEKRDSLQKQEAGILQRIQKKSKTIGKLWEENLHLKQQLEEEEILSTSRRELVAEAKQAKSRSEMQRASLKRAVENLTKLLADTQKDHHQSEDRNSELQGQIKKLKMEYQQQLTILEESNKYILTTEEYGEGLCTKIVELETRLRKQESSNVEMHQEKDEAMQEQEVLLKTIRFKLDFYKEAFCILVSVMKSDDSSDENIEIAEKFLGAEWKLLEAEQQGAVEDMLGV